VTTRRLGACCLAVSLALGALACGGGEDPGRQSLASFKSTLDQRAARRAYDGAPPVIPHAVFGKYCGACHDDRGVAVAGLGFAPPSPHGLTPGLGAARCAQCHVTQSDVPPFVASRFVGLPQEAVPGPRHHELAPPVIPHRVFLRENCLACHGGEAAREELRTAHPERTRCRQCHAEGVDA
jgi:nitrate reductase (cytochrome), electron transfer subunit